MDMETAMSASKERSAQRQKRRSHLRKKRKKDDDDDEGGGVEAERLKSQANVGSSKAGGQGLSVAGGPDRSKSAGEAGIHYESTGGVIQRGNDMGATKTLEIDTQADRDGRALREKRLKSAGGDGEAAEETTTATYKGMLGYKDYRSGFRREQNASNMKTTGAFGPLRASTSIRTTFRMDYQPDICKDYKETGFCGYGDSCKFLHDRGDYKSGWQLEQEWEAKQKFKREQKAAEAMLGEGDSNDEDEEEDDGLPFACHICRLPFKSPVVTKCRHYFCESCALKQNAKNGKCAVCGQATNGTFNVAVEIVKKMKKIEEENRKNMKTEESFPLPPPPPPPQGAAAAAEEEDYSLECPPCPPSPPPPPPPEEMMRELSQGKTNLDQDDIDCDGDIDLPPPPPPPPPF